MSKNRRAFLIVLDSVGIGEAPDAMSFGDAGANTLKSVWNTGILKIPNLLKMGFGNIDGLDFLPSETYPIASFARMQERSAGKDTTIGHWEIAGRISKNPLPTFPNGFPEEFIRRFSDKVGREVICNKTYSGTDVIRDYGEEHINTGKLILYTSADSVFQIAAHIDIVPLEELYEICRCAREMLIGDDLGVGRVIARPFKTENGVFKRTADRKDFSLMPPKDLLPEVIVKAGLDSISIGKINDIFAGCGFTESYMTHSNREGMDTILSVAKKEFNGLCFANLVDFDMLWGHRRDACGYANGLSKFDAWLPLLLAELDENDLLMITADHGCDPTFFKTTDHTREYTPLICYTKGSASLNYGTRDTFADIAATVAKWLDLSFSCDGVSL